MNILFKLLSSLLWLAVIVLLLAAVAKTSPKIRVLKANESYQFERSR